MGDDQARSYTTADGLNLHRGISNVIVEESFFRNNGDDGTASWAENLANHAIVFRHNTVIAPILASGVAIYGGHDIEVSDNLIADTLTEGGGLHLGNRFSAVPLSGKISLKRNMVVRGGSFDPRWHIGVGAVWLSHWMRRSRLRSICKRRPCWTAVKRRCC